jgi:molybdate transport system ATP-binding protein
VTLTLRAKVQSRDLDIELTLGDRERVAILGPNGAGKSSVLAVLAGLLKPDTGRAELDGRVLFDLDGSRRRWVPPHARGISLMAQDALLFPHLSALENVAFGPRAAGQSRSGARATARSWLDEVGALEFVDRKPAELSGGQAQRVAIGRALASNPRLLLLDEPMAALDVGAAPVLRQVLRRVLTERSAILVTHDLLDALLLAQRVIVLDQGRIVESGPTADVIRHPRTAFTARIAGLNMIEGIADAAGVRPPGADPIGGVPRTATQPGEPAIAVFAPSAISVFTEPPHGSPRNTIRVTIAELEPRDAQVRVRAEMRGGHTLTADVTAPVVSELDLYPGKAVFFSIKATAVTIYPT